jgi:hypothetical protein
MAEDTDRVEGDGAAKAKAGDASPPRPAVVPVGEYPPGHRWHGPDADGSTSLMTRPETALPLREEKPVIGDATDVVIQIAADRQRRFHAATQSGAIAPLLPLPPEPSGSTSPSSESFGGTPGTASPATIPINQTVYSAETVTIQNSITFNFSNPDVRELNDTLRQLLTAIEGSNEASAEVRRQLSAEMTAGTALLQAPKVEPNAIQLYLINPLKWIAEKFAAVVVADLAKHALELLWKVLSGP